MVVKWFDMIYSPRHDAFREARLNEVLSPSSRVRLSHAANVGRRIVKAQLMEFLYDSIAKSAIKHIFSIIVGTSPGCEPFYANVAFT